MSPLPAQLPPHAFVAFSAGLAGPRARQCRRLVSAAAGATAVFPCTRVVRRTASVSKLPAMVTVKSTLGKLVIGLNFLADGDSSALRILLQEELPVEEPAAAPEIDESSLVEPPAAGEAEAATAEGPEAEVNRDVSLVHSTLCTSLNGLQGLTQGGAVFVSVGRC